MQERLLIQGGKDKGGTREGAKNSTESAKAAGEGMLALLGGLVCDARRGLVGVGVLPGRWLLLGGFITHSLLMAAVMGLLVGGLFLGHGNYDATE
jgi:hypothetical protein